jgi:hypothetical protein
MAAATPHFDVVTSNQSLGRNMPQAIGRMLWAPMLLMSFMLFGAGFVVGVIRATEIADAGGADTIAQLRHVGSGFMFLGFAALFSSIDFAIAKILGEFRKGGGEVQAATGRVVQTIKMPLTAKLFIVLMAMAMMLTVVLAILHFVFAADVSATAASLEDSEQRSIVLEGFRRVGIAMFLLSFLLGLATIVQVLRFQSVRIRELVGEPIRE